MDDRETGSYGPGAEKVVTVLGFGLFLVTYSGGPFGFVSGSEQQAVGWEGMLLVQTSFFMAVALGCLVLGVLVRRNGDAHGGVWGLVGYLLVALLGLVMQPILDGMGGRDTVVARTVLSLASGWTYAVPFVFWVGRFCRLSATMSHYGLAGLLMLGYLVSPAIIVCCSLLGDVPYRYSVVLLASAAVSCLICFWLNRRWGTDSDALGSPSRPLTEAWRYRLTTYSAALLVSLGFSWGISDAASVFGLVGFSSSEKDTSIVMAFVPMLILAAAAWAHVHRSDIRFGAIVRLAVVACGAVLATFPLVTVTAPALLYPLCNIAMIAGEMALIAFCIDVCNEEGRPVAPVFALNLALFMAVSCLAAALFWLVHSLVGGQVAWLVIGALSMWAVLLVIPFLPSRSSNAVVLLSKTLPENEGYEANVAMRRACMAQRYGLSEGESAVLEGLVRGKKREEIADDMGLSPWTIKARISAIYRKCGVHSYKELVQLMAAD